MATELEDALRELAKQGEGLIVATTGFVNATLRAATIAGRAVSAPPTPPTFAKPDAPTGLAAAPLVSGANFWAAVCDVAESNDEFPVIGYRWYENGVPVGQRPANEFVRLNRQPSTAYTVQVSSYTIWAESDLSDPIVITTDASGGVDPPQDTTAPSAPVLDSVVADNSTTITAEFTGSTDTQSGVAWYELQIDDKSVSAVLHPGTEMSYGAMTQGRTYSVRIVAVDYAGNRSTPSNEASVTMPDAIVPEIPGRTIGGSAATLAPITTGTIDNTPPSIPGRTITGAATTGLQTGSGSITNTPTVDLPPVWTTPSVDTTYTFNEGDVVDIPLAATDPEGNPITYAFASGTLPTGVSPGVNAQGVFGLRGTIQIGAGGYPTPVDYDSYYDASDVVAVTPPSISTTSIATGTVGVAYSQQFAATNGTGPPWAWVLTTQLPAPLDTELTMDPLTGVLAGTPSVTFGGPIVVTATDPAGNVATKQFTLDIFPYITSEDTPESMWQGQRTAPGVMLAKRLDNLADIDAGGGANPGMAHDGGYAAGLWSLDTNVKAHGAGSLRFACLDTTGAIASNWCHYLDGAGARRFYQVGEGFWWQVMFRLNDARMRHWPLTTGADAGHKIVIVDRFRQTAGVRELVMLNSGARGWLSSYVGLGVSQTWGNGGVQRPAPGSDYYRHPAYDAGAPANPATNAERMRRYGPMRYASAGNSYQGPTGRGANCPDPNIGSPTFEADGWYVVTGHVAFRSLDGSDGLYQLWGGRKGGLAELLISQQDVNFRLSQVSNKSANDSTPGNLGYSGITLTDFQTDNAADPGRDPMYTYYQHALVTLGPIQHWGPSGLRTLPGIIDA